MTEHHYFTCDECNKELDNVECSVKQVLYYLEVLSDTDQGFSKAHLCTVECLRLFTKKRIILNIVEELTMINLS